MTMQRTPIIHRLRSISPPCVACIALLLLPGARDCRAQPDAEVTATGADDRIDAAVERGLEWLTAAQQPDGSWGSGAFRGSAAVTAHGMMALVGAGNTPASGRQAAVVTRAVTFLLAAAGGNGLIAGHEEAAHGPMYGHAFATISLAEVYGETEDDDAVARVLERARDLIERTQNAEGGWRYQPERGAADISVTVAMLNALRALRNAGFDVSQPAVDGAVGYLRRLQNADGGFRYQAEPGPSAAPRTAAAVFALLAAGSADRQAVERGMAWLDAHPVRLGAADGYALYGLFYTAAARWQVAGDGPTEAWSDWYAATSAALIAAQQEDGSWADPSCPEYGTSAALAVLQMPGDLTPLYQQDRGQR